MTGPRIGLMGCGIWGKNILRELLELGAKVLVVDEDAGARERALAHGAAQAVATAVGLGGLNGWVVATPASAHLGCISSVAGDAVPILCEKPLASSLGEAGEIATFLRAPFHVLDVWRYHPAVERLQVLANSRELGAASGLRSLRANWTSPRTDVDTAWNLLPHDISIYLQVFGALPAPTAALGERVDGQIRSVWSQWSGPAWMASEVSNRHPTRRRELQLHCEHGVASWDSAQPERLLLASGPADEHLAAREQRSEALPPETALRRQLADWLRFLAGGAEPRTDLALALQSCELVERVRAMARAA